MSNTKTILSICIPTYNRADCLEQCLEAMVSQESFDEVEVVISDNCSTDATESVGRNYADKYSNIKYFRNDKNVEDLNFSLAFQRATGVLRKLTNDTVIYRPGAIRYMLGAVKENLEKRPQVYFLSVGSAMEDKSYASSLDEYISLISYNLTWIRSIAVWEDECEDLGVLAEKASSHMGQIPFLLENFEKHGGAVIYNREIMDSGSVEKKNLSYGLYKVFYENFLGFIKPYVDDGKISYDVYENLRKDLLINYFCGWIAECELNPDKYILSDENIRQLIEDAYGKEPYFNVYRKKLKILKIKGIIKKIVRRS